MTGRGRGGQDGIISVVLALSMALFLALLAVVVDLGAIWTAKAGLDGATSSAAAQAAGILAREGCAAFDVAATAADDAVDASAPGAAVDRFEVVYGISTITAAGQCASLPPGVDEEVGRVVVATSDSREAAFAGAFTDGTLWTRAETHAEWGHVTALAGGMRPLSLCTRHDAWDNTDGDGYLEYLADLDAGQPTDDDDLRFTITVDADDGSPCPVASGGAGALPHVDFLGIEQADEGDLVAWLTDGAPVEVGLDDPTTLATNEAVCVQGATNPARCPGVTRQEAPEDASDWAPLVGQTFPILLHDQVLCQRSNGNCSGNGQQHWRAYPVAGVVRVRLLCVGTPSGSNPPFHQAPDLSEDDAEACEDLEDDLEDAGGTEVRAVFRFAIGTTISEGNLADRPWDPNARFLGVSVCSVDGDGDCHF